MYRFNKFVNDSFYGYVVCDSGIIEADPVAQHLVSHALDVFRDSESTPVDQCGSLRDLEEVDRCTGAGADSDVVGELLVDVGCGLTGRSYNIGDVFFDRRVDVDQFCNVLNSVYIFWRRRRS